MADPLTAIVGQQHGFGAIEDLVQIKARPFEGGAEFIAVIFHRRSGRGADQSVTVEGADDHRLGTVAIGGKIAPLIVQIAVVQVGPVAKDRDPQRRHVPQHRIQRGAGQAAHRDRHAETCAIQSLRL